MTVITMSRNELTRLRVLIDVADGRLSVADATGLIGVGRRQIYRLLQAFRADGADGLISRKRGGPSNRALGLVFRETVLAIVRQRCGQDKPVHGARVLRDSEKALIRTAHARFAVATDPGKSGPIYLH